MFTAMKKSLVSFCVREDGPTAVEYAVMLSLVIVVCLGAVAILGTSTDSTFKAVKTEVEEIVE